MKKNQQDWGEESLNKANTVIETQTSLDIKIHSEVEKIWINYDLDGNGSLDF